ncbi:holo-ACP synthase [Cellulosilyticum ruminicola]|uniref:holo-ACP synthase n=1 Tax=Cellulosilyticum ruminicola TaxID=425254 RepID=UPI0006D29A44|nr:holo-ACP synthase [Cellulosilyticum ruminicola]
MIVGIGTDIIEIKRIEKAVTKTPSFFNKIFTEKERAYFKTKNNRAETIAGVFAAKEAVSKALGTGFRSFAPRDIEITPDKLGKPQVCLLGCAKKLGQQIGIQRILVSISHCQTYAVAYALAEGGEEI